MATNHKADHSAIIHNDSINTSTCDYSTNIDSLLNYHAREPDAMSATARRHKKLRRLYDASRLDAIHNVDSTILLNETNAKVRLKAIALSVFATSGLTLLLGFTLLCISGHISISHMIDDFNAKYTNQYMSITHNKNNYCDRDLDFKDLFMHLRSGVLNQEKALSQLENVLRNGSTQIQTVAIVGSSGIGKSLTARLLREHYPWPENVQIFVYNMNMLSNEDKLERIKYMLENMSKCGRNLFIIDNLLPNERHVVQDVKDLIIQDNEEKEQKLIDCLNHNGDDCALIKRHFINKHVTVLFIFNLNLVLPYSVFDKQREFLRKLPDTTVINYQSFNHKHLADCIHNELRLEDMVIEEEFFNDILDYTDVEASGCKTTYAKVRLYARDANRVKRELEMKNHVIKPCYN